MEFIPADAELPVDTLLLANTEDVLRQAERLHRHPAVALQFPDRSDARAYSQALLLRARVQYAGQIIAVGDVISDMAPLLRRCGFSATRMRADQRIESARRSLGLHHG